MVYFRHTFKNKACFNMEIYMGKMLPCRFFYLMYPLIFMRNNENYKFPFRLELSWKRNKSNLGNITKRGIRWNHIIDTLTKLTEDQRLLQKLLSTNRFKKKDPKPLVWFVSTATTLCPLIGVFR
jgi:hypothetical protein